jgi:isoleucyl-tRNA synthetase
MFYSFHDQYKIYLTYQENFSFLSVIVSFQLEETPGVSMIAWTTTPWTLPSNLSLCVNPTMDYVKVKGENKMNK